MYIYIYIYIYIYSNIYQYRTPYYRLRAAISSNLPHKLIKMVEYELENDPVSSDFSNLTKYQNHCFCGAPESLFLWCTRIPVFAVHHNPCFLRCTRIHVFAVHQNPCFCGAPESMFLRCDKINVLWCTRIHVFAVHQNQRFCGAPTIQGPGPVI